MLLSICLAMACTDATQPAPPIASVDGPAARPAASVRVPVPKLVPRPSPATTYDAPTNLYDAYFNYHGGSLTSRYVLYPSGAFTLQFNSPRFGFFEYPGEYVRTDSEVTLRFGGWSTAGAWEAHATMHGDSLRVTYNLIMTLSDFIDGVYVRAAR
jgi:hypothetical protein